MFLSSAIAACWPAIALLPGLVLASCRIEPKTPRLHFALSDTAGGAAEKDEDGAPKVPVEVQAHIQGALEMLFGRPEAPQFMVTEEWYDEGFNPNFPKYAADDQGSGELSEEDLEAIEAGNEKLFERALELSRAGRFDEVELPSHMIGLAEGYAETIRDFKAEQEAVAAGKGDAEELALLEQDLKEGMLLGWYPSLRDSAELYRQQCFHCHGVEGGGNGPTAPFLNPVPRDYRQGQFKFTAQNNKARPRRADLLHILEQGVTGTAMPSFRRFSPAELSGLVDYVRLLSIRGEVERDLVVTYLADYEYEQVLPLSAVVAAYQDVWERWLTADEQYVAFEGEIPEVSDELLARGRELFLDASKGNCQSCHGANGLGDGPSAYELEEDGSFRLDAKGARISAYKDDWGHPIFPRDLTRGIYRGGKRPIDIYRRIYAGINGTPMPGIGESKAADGSPLLSGDDMWAMVHYVRSMSARPISHHEEGHDESHEASADHH